MKKLLVLFVIFLNSFVLPTQSLKVYAQPKDEAEIIQMVDEYIQAEMKAAHIPGLSLGIVNDNQVVHLKGYGKSDDKGTPVSPKTPFILGSTSKSFTAMAIMKLAEEGQVDLDASIDTYLPAITIPNTPKITVRNLLNQTSGISGSPDQKDSALKINKDNIGKAFEYSNENYKLLGDIIKSVTKMPYGEYIYENIYLPLNMNNSYTSQEEAEANGLSSGYRTWFGFNVVNKLSFNKEYLSAGYLISSAEDMAHFLIVQMNDGQFQNRTIISRSSLETMHKPSVKAPIMGEDSSYGMGWFTTLTNGVPTIRHSGEVPNYHSTLIIMPNENYGVVLLANVNNSILISGLIEKIASGVVDILAGNTPTNIDKFTYYKTYIVMNSIIFIFSTLLFIHIINIKKWNARLLSGKGSTFKSFIYPFIFTIILPLLILALLPQSLGFTWSFLFEFVPDATSVAFSTSIILLLIGGYKVLFCCWLLLTGRKGYVKTKIYSNL